jgi:hypothetical protein
VHGFKEDNMLKYIARNRKMKILQDKPAGQGNEAQEPTGQYPPRGQ